MNDKIKQLESIKFQNTILDIATELSRENHHKMIQDLDAILDKDIPKSEKRIEMTSHLITNSERYTIELVKRVFNAFIREMQ